jgi:SAM-dependent methyltransferase
MRILQSAQRCRPSNPHDPMRLSLFRNPFVLVLAVGTIRLSNNGTIALGFHPIRMLIDSTKRIAFHNDRIVRRCLRSSHTRQVNLKLLPSDTDSDISKVRRNMNDTLDWSHDAEGEEDAEDDNTVNAQSAFGTKIYWNEMYSGRGDFSSDQYSWYYGWETIQPFWFQATQLLQNCNITSDHAMISSILHQKSQKLDTSSTVWRVLLPGVGNDSDMIYKIYKNGHYDITAIDYSPHAIERLTDYLPFLLPSHHHKIKLHVMDARCLDSTWSNYFDIILEKGTLDAIYLSSCRTDSKNAKTAISELYRVLRPEGVLISISGVIPENIRRELFPSTNAVGSNSPCWEWIRDGNNDLQAGCFIFRKK